MGVHIAMYSLVRQRGVDVGFLAGSVHVVDEVGRLGGQAAYLSVLVREAGSRVLEDELQHGPPKQGQAGQGRLVGQPIQRLSRQDHGVAAQPETLGT